jgi:hypothetical protein
LLLILVHASGTSRNGELFRAASPAEGGAFFSSSCTRNSVILAWCACTIFRTLSISALKPCGTGKLHPWHKKHSQLISPQGFEFNPVSNVGVHHCAQKKLAL